MPEISFSHMAPICHAPSPFLVALVSWQISFLEIISSGEKSGLVSFHLGWQLLSLCGYVDPANTAPGWSVKTRAGGKGAASTPQAGVGLTPDSGDGTQKLFCGKCQSQHPCLPLHPPQTLCHIFGHLSLLFKNFSFHQFSEECSLHFSL